MMCQHKWVWGEVTTEHFQDEWLYWITFYKNVQYAKCSKCGKIKRKIL